MTRRVRLIAWAVLLAVAAFQAYAQRYVIGPDGMSYLDLSDAVTLGAWRRLLDLYWSPLYPALIGIARFVTGAGPRTEIAVVHAVNLVCFAVMLAAFEYLLASILALAARVRGPALRGPWALAAAYGFFGVLAFTMTPLELTTPDLLSDAAIFFALGALLRLRDSAGHGTRDAVVFGLALGLGGLAKSFLIPWAVVCFAVLLVAVRRRGTRELAIAAGVWLVFIVPWSVALSVKAGRPTFGDAGRLTYAWFVNLQNPPSMGGVPVGARTQATDAILEGVGVPGDSPYADPMWADPARFSRAVVPHFSVSDQAKTLKVFHVFYVENLAPLLFLVLIIATAPRGTRRTSWTLGWPLYVPAIAGLFVYAMVVVTTRYVMPFVLGITLTLVATIPLARRFVPLYALIGVAIPIALEALLPETLVGLALEASIVGGILAAVLVPSSRRAAWMTGTLLALVTGRILIAPGVSPSLVLLAAIVAVAGILVLVRPPRRAVWAVVAIMAVVTARVALGSDDALLRIGAAGLAILYWRIAASAVQSHEPVWFARRTHAALALVLVAVFAFRVYTRFDADRGALDHAQASTWGNVPWNIAQELAAHGIAPGTRIALVGPHAESYFVRTARLHIVANVPRNRVVAFWALPKPAQDSLLALFRAAGATMAVATMGPSGASPDSSWKPVKYNGWIRPLVP